MKVIFIIILSLCSVLLFAQTIQYRQDRIFADENLNKNAEKLAKVRVKAQLIHLAVEFGKEAKYLYEQNKYDKSGRIIETRDYLPDGSNPFISNFYYDIKGQIIKKYEEYKTSDTSLSVRINTFHYDSKGRLESYAAFNPESYKDSNAIVYDDAENTMSLTSFVND